MHSSNFWEIKFFIHYVSKSNTRQLIEITIKIFMETYRARVQSEQNYNGSNILMHNMYS